MQLIPAIDLREGRCVRLYQGDFARVTRYSADPAELLLRYQALGASWLHVVDLDAARDGNARHRGLIVTLARLGRIRLQVGGGLRTARRIAALLEAGVARVLVGSAAVERPAAVSRWLRRFGPECVCLALDVRVDDRGEPRVCTHGWTRSHRASLWEAVERYRGQVRHVLCTDIARDGALRGPNLDLYRQARERFPHLEWQASGGVRSVRDLAALADIGVAAAVTGRALLEGRLPFKELQPFLPDASLPASTSATA